MYLRLLLQRFFTLTLLLAACTTRVFAQAPAISYQTPLVYTVNQPITAVAPVNTGGNVSATHTFTTLISGIDFFPQGMDVDGAGNVYLADYNASAIEKVAINGTVSIAGSGIHHPFRLTSDAAGKYLYVVDYSLHLYKIETATNITTAITSVKPTDVTLDAAGNIYVAESTLNDIKKISVTDGSTTTIASGLSLPYILTVDALGSRIYFAESNQPQIKTLNTATNAITALPFQTSSYKGRLCLDKSGNLYYSDDSTVGAIRKYNSTDGTLTTLASDIQYLTSIGVDANGIVYELEGPTTVKKLSSAAYTIDKALPAGLTFDSTTGIISGTPTVSSPATNYIITAYNKDGSSTATLSITVKEATSAPSSAASAPNIRYQTPQVYAVNTSIVNLKPTNTGGAVPVSIYGQLSVFAGGNSAGTVDGQGTNARFSYPSSIASDKDGNLYVIDYGTKVLRKITPDGQVSTWGQYTPTPAQPGDEYVQCLTVDNNGNIYLGSGGRIFKATPDHIITVFAGNINGGTLNGQGTAASFSLVAGLTHDANGNLYAGEATGNKIRKITSTALVTTVAGTGEQGYQDGAAAQAKFAQPDNLVIDANGNIYVSDLINQVIRKITPNHVVSTLAGTAGVRGAADGQGTAASFNSPLAMTIDNESNLFVIDAGGKTIRKITPSGLVTTIVGQTTPSNIDNFKFPYGIAYDNRGNLYVTDADANQIKKISLTGYTIDKALPPGLVFDSATGIVSGTPSSTWPATDYTVTAYNQYGSSSTVVNIRVVGVLKSSVITYASPVRLKLSTDKQPIILNPGASSTNPETPVTYTSSNPDVAYIGTDGQLHVIAPGTVTITASQAGNDNYSAATPVPAQYIVTQAQAISFQAISARSLCDADFSVDAVSTNPQLPLSYSSSNPAVATVSSTGLVHLLSAGATTITVSQAGNTLFEAADAKSQTFTITSLLTPSVRITPDHYDSCDGLLTVYTAIPVNAGQNPTYQWQLNGVNTGINAPTYSSSTLKTGDQITCTVTNTDGCRPVTSPPSNVGTLTSDPMVSPTISIAASVQGEIMAGTPVTFTATVTTVQTGDQYQWQVNGINAGTNSANFTTTTLADGDVVTCILASEGRCVATPVVTSNAITVHVTTPVNVVVTTPNTFTPNGDGVNDLWTMPGLTAYPNCRVTVYSRYGERVYQSAMGYPKPWDGTTGGKPLPAGTYYYVIDLRNGKKPLSGYVTLLR